MKADSGITHWSWVDQPRRTRGVVGGHSRPWAVRDRLVTEAVAEEVRRLRAQAGMSVRQLAERLSLSQPAVTGMELGKKTIALPVLWDLADIFMVPPSHFITVADQAIERFERKGRRARRGSARPPETGAKP